MFHLTLMAGARVRLTEPDNLVITVWGGTEILLPTLAEKMLRIKKARTQDFPEDYLIRRAHVITFQGGTAFKLPTLAREIEEMLKLREVLSEEEAYSLWQEAAQTDDLDQFEMFTVMAGAAEEAPSVKEEMKELERLVLKGLLSKEEVEALRATMKGDPSAATRTDLVREKIKNLLMPASVPISSPSMYPTISSKVSQ
jgi:hypothetical protein